MPVEGFELFVKDWGPTSLLGAFIIALLLGLLDTRWSVKKKLDLIQASRDEALEREKYYRTANEKLQETVNLQAQQLGDLMEQGKTIVALLGSIAESARQSQVGGRHRG